MPAGPGIGARLRAARERAGFTVIEAAERLHMEPRMVEALDAENFGFLGAPVYARGHLRRYAELVGEDSAALLRLYALNLAPTATPDLRQVPYRDRSPAAPRHLLPQVAAGLVILALVGVVAWSLRAGRASAPATAERELPVPGPVPAVSVAREMAPPAPMAAVKSPAMAGPAAITEARPGVPEAPAGPPATSAVPPRAQPVAAAQAAPSEPPPGEVSGAPLELDLKFATDSWTEVYDADGNRLYYDLAAANSRHTLAGKAPLRVVLGHAPGVSVAVNGHSAVIPTAALRSDVAEFVVNGAGRLGAGR
jgi:cytoskeleton protein RodZ